MIRNVGGRITPSTLETMAMLRNVAQANGGDLGGPGWNLILLHHTDCGIKHLNGAPKLLAQYFGVSTADLDAMAINDPRASVALDIATLRANTQVPDGFLVTGLVYDVATGAIETVAAPERLRPSFESGDPA